MIATETATSVKLWRCQKLIQFLRNTWRDPVLIVHFMRPEIRLGVAYKEIS